VRPPTSEPVVSSVLGKGGQREQLPIRKRRRLGPEKGRLHRAEKVFGELHTKSGTACTDSQHSLEGKEKKDQKGPGEKKGDLEHPHECRARKRVRRKDGSAFWLKTPVVN